MSKNSIVRELVTGIRQGHRGALSRAITLVESRRTEDREATGELLSECLKMSRSAIRIAISGPPGAGKSTLIESLGMEVLSSGRSLAVLAIDPSSEASGGSILGDKTRMQRLSAQAGAFVRPSPSSGQLGGVARRTRETALLCEAFGYQVIFIETVGVGQSEVAAQKLSDLFLLLLLPGAGDELQGIKRGIVELADMIVVNKADQDRESLAKKSQQEYKRALHLFPTRDSGIETEVMLASALEGRGIPELWETIQSYIRKVRDSGYFEKRRKEQALSWFNESFMDQWMEKVRQLPGFSEEKNRLTKEILEGKITAFQGADELLRWIKW